MSERSRIAIDLCHVTAINFEINIQATHKYTFCIRISMEFPLAEFLETRAQKTRETCEI